MSNPPENEDRNTDGSDASEDVQDTSDASDSDQERPDDSPPPEPSKPGGGQWLLKLAGIVAAIYCLVLAFFTLDQILGWGFYPSRLEKQIRTRINELVSTDQSIRTKAELRLKEGDAFVVIPELIRRLNDPSPDIRREVHKLLEEVTRTRLKGNLFGYDPNAPAEERRNTQVALWKWWDSVEEYY